MFSFVKLLKVGVAIQRYIEYLCTVDMESPERIFLAILAIHILQEFNAILGETARQVIKSLLHLGEVDGNSCPCWTFLENRTTTSARLKSLSVVRFLPVFFCLFLSRTFSQYLGENE